MQILVFALVFSIFGPGRGVGQQPAAAGTSNRVKSKWFKYQQKVELCYNIVL